MRITDIVLAIAGLWLLVVVHETGHYLAARAFGMRVLRYSIGFGTVIFKHRAKNGTIFQICALPFIAYVQIAGMNPHEEVDPLDPTLYPNKGVIPRIITIVAGPVANYLTASVLVFCLALTGWPSAEPKEPMTVASVLDGTPAAEAGIREGDVIVEANGRPVRHVDDLIDITAPSAGKESLEYVIVRGGRRLAPMSIQPRLNDARTAGVIGVSPQRLYVPLSLGDSARLAVVHPLVLTVGQLYGMADMVRRRTTEGLTSVVGMGKIVAEQARKGPREYVGILILLSVALGLFNLIPFPALDGGRLVFLAYELITRRRPNERFEAVVHTVGLIFLLGVILLVTFRDVMG